MFSRCLYCNIIIYVLALLMAMLPVLAQAQQQTMDQIQLGARQAGSVGVESSLDKMAPIEGATLETALQAAIELNPRILSSKYAVEAANQGYLQSYGALLPSLDFSGSGGHQLQRNGVTIARYSSGEKSTWTNEEELVLSQLIFDGGLTDSKVEADKFYSQSKQEELYNTAEAVGLSATQSFLEVIRNRALVDLCKRNVMEHQRIKDLTRIRLDSGGGTSADVTQAEAALNEAQSTLLQAEQGLQDAEAGYAMFYGENPRDLAMPQRLTQVIPLSLDSAVAMAVKDNKALKAAWLAVSQKEKEVASAKGLFMPAVYAQASVGRSDNISGYTDSYYDASGMIVVKMNLYNGGSDNAALQEAKNELLKAKYSANDVERTVIKDMKDAYNFFKTTAQLLPILRNTTNKNADVVVSYADQFRMGTRTLLDLVSAQKALFNSQQIYLSGIVAHTFSYYRMCVPRSMLMSTLGIDLGVIELAQYK